MSVTLGKPMSMSSLNKVEGAECIALDANSTSVERASIMSYASVLQGHFLHTRPVPVQVESMVVPETLIIESGRGSGGSARGQKKKGPAPLLSRSVCLFGNSVYI